MNTELFIRRPVMTTLVMLGILIFGIVAYRQLPVSDLPAVDYPSISVSVVHSASSGLRVDADAAGVAEPNMASGAIIARRSGIRDNAWNQRLRSIEQLHPTAPAPAPASSTRRGDPGAPERSRCRGRRGGGRRVRGAAGEAVRGAGDLQAGLPGTGGYRSDDSRARREVFIRPRSGPVAHLVGHALG